MPKNILFMLLDDNLLANQVTNLANKMGWNVKHARCVESGMSVAKDIVSEGDDNPRNILGFIDLTLALTKTDRENLDKYLKEREELLEKYLSQDLIEDIDVTKLIQAKKDFHVFDDKIRPLLSLDGGRKFLEDNKEKMSAWKVVIFSTYDQARSHKPINKLLGNNLINWLQKPASIENIRLILENNYTREE